MPGTKIPEMKRYNIFYLFLIFFSGCYEHDSGSFYNALNNIRCYDVMGFLETEDNNLLLENKPLIVPATGYVYLYPYDSFVKVYNKFTGEEYYTRDLFFVTAPDEEFTVCTENYSDVNFIFLEEKDNRFFFVFAYVPFSYLIPNINGTVGNVIPADEIIIINNIEVIFYRPIGRIIETIGNVYFKFENIEEISGVVVFDYANLSNVNILKQLDIVKLYIQKNDIGFLNSFYSKDYYLNKIYEAYNAIKINGVNSIIDPYNIKYILKELLSNVDYDPNLKTGE